jgi:hypothetical protein
MGLIQVFFSSSQVKKEAEKKQNVYCWQQWGEKQ